MRVQLRDPQSRVLLEELDLDDGADAPQPGRWLECGGRSFLVLQRSHRYRLRDGRYELVAVPCFRKAPVSAAAPTNLAEAAVPLCSP
jgi:hypothetical protein